MRIGLYGMPTAGKSYILNKIDFIEVVEGSKLLREIDPEFDYRNGSERRAVRNYLATRLLEKTSFIMDGHYAFGNEIAFTEADGRLYDVIVYLYISPDILIKRMKESDKNRKYLKYDIQTWQNWEVENLRGYCHSHNKDFYVIDNPPQNYFEDITDVISFIREINDGYSCKAYAQKCADDILDKSKSETIILLDGDKTLTTEDTSHAVFGYKTHIYDGNFYTGYQAWKQQAEFERYSFEDLTDMPVKLNEKVKSALTTDSFILTSGHERVWSFISKQLGLKYYYGTEMSAETKMYITKLLQDAGKYVVAYGDGMNDYYMLKQADEGYLVTKTDGSISRSLKGKDMEGLIIVCT